jgi:DNA-damage-inducible protein D
MQTQAIQLLKNQFDALSHTSPEGWVESCETTGYAADDHFRGVTKMIGIGQGGLWPANVIVTKQKGAHR